MKNVHDLPRFPVKKGHAGLRVAAAMLFAPMALCGLWEWFSPGSPILTVLVFVARCCYFIVVVACAAVAFGWDEDDE